MAKRRASPHHAVLPSVCAHAEEVSHGILRSPHALPAGVASPCNVTMEEYVLNLELLLSQDLGSSNFF